METYIISELIYFITDQNTSLLGTKVSQPKERQHQVFPRLQSSFLPVTDVNTSDTMTDIRDNALAPSRWAGSWGNGRALMYASDFRFQFPRAGLCQGISSFLRGVGSRISNSAGLMVPAMSAVQLQSISLYHRVQDPDRFGDTWKEFTWVQNAYCTFLNRCVSKVLWGLFKKKCACA